MPTLRRGRHASAGDTSDRKRLGAALLAWTLALGLPAGVGYALWSASGSGDGAGKARTAQPLTVTAGTASADLYPGFTGGDVYLKVDNPNPYPVQIRSATFGAVTSSDPTNCPASNLTATAATGLTVNVPAGATNQAVSLADVLTLASTAPDGCQGVTFTIVTTVSGSQV